MKAIDLQSNVTVDEAGRLIIVHRVIRAGIGQERTFKHRNQQNLWRSGSNKLLMYRQTKSCQTSYTFSHITKMFNAREKQDILTSLRSPISFASMLRGPANTRCRSPWFNLIRIKSRHSHFSNVLQPALFEEACYAMATPPSRFTRSNLFRALPQLFADSIQRTRKEFVDIILPFPCRFCLRLSSTRSNEESASIRFKSRIARRNQELPGPFANEARC